MAKVLAAVHFPRLYVLNRDERNILPFFDGSCHFR
jgi:hypothetical protein